MSDSGYTPSEEDVPTQEDVRWAYVVGEFERRGHRGPIHDRGRPFYEAFDSWLAAHDAEKDSRIAEIEEVVKRAIHAAHTYPNLWDHVESRDSFVAILSEAVSDV